MKILIGIYEKTVKAAKREVLKTTKVILCTNSTSGANLLIDELKGRVKQVIIDEAAMCIEVETLIPIVTYEPDKIVLVGDQQQLQPIITCQAGIPYGLKQSLFNRYTKLMKEKILMLTKQYRMHSEIVQFPSNHFYEGKLVTDSNWQNEPTKMKIFNKLKRALFCHIEGEEKTNFISTADAAEMSKSNFEEAQFVTKALEDLKQNNINPQNIAVLTPYRAQILEISKLIKTKLYKESKFYDRVALRTIVSSQGSEWDFVILSCVRSYSKQTAPVKSLGTIGSPNNINVAITRAKKGLIIIGKQFINLFSIYDII